MGLWAGVFGGWTSGGRWGEAVLRTTGESGFVGSITQTQRMNRCSVGSYNGVHKKVF